MTDSSNDDIEWELDEESVHTIKGMAGNDSDLLKELFDTYLQQTAALIADIRQFLAAGDDENLRQVVHNLKGSSANMGAMSVSKICKKIETRIKSGELDDMENLLTQLDTHCAQTDARIIEIRDE
ncbi:MAG: Hpt domain-containing protein [Pseudomonadota bacterium]